VSAVNSTLSGAVSAASAAITGDVSAATATLSGDVSATNATLSGDVSAANAEFGEDLTVLGNTILGDAATDTVTISGPATLSSTLAVTGAITGSNAALSGDVSAVNATLSGNVSASTANLGAFTVTDTGKVGIGTAAPTVALEVNGTIKAAGFEGAAHVHFLTNSKIIRMAGDSESTMISDISVPTEVPDNAIGLITNIISYDTASKNDNVIHAFGRQVHTIQKNWDHSVWDANLGALKWYEDTAPAETNDVVITHLGLDNRKADYGVGHGTHIIPLKANKKFDACLCIGYDQHGTYYVAVKVVGYITN
jgi:hypothetical protein